MSAAEINSIKRIVRKARKEAERLGATLQLEVSNFIDQKHLNCFWYNGCIGVISFGGYAVRIEVHGDIGISVLSEDLSEEIASFSYRNGHRPIDDDELKELIPNDRALRNMDSVGRIYWSNNNWVEFVIFDENGREVTSPLCDDTVIDDDVPEAFDDIAWYIDRIKKYPILVEMLPFRTEMNKEEPMDNEKKNRDEKTMSKKGNMAYWDSIEQLAENYIRQLIPYSTKPIDFGDDNDDDHATTIMEISKEVTEFTYKLLESQYGADFPYVEENF